MSKKYHFQSTSLLKFTKNPDVLRKFCQQNIARLVRKESQGNILSHFREIFLVAVCNSL